MLERLRRRSLRRWLHPDGSGRKDPAANQSLYAHWDPSRTLSTGRAHGCLRLYYSCKVKENRDLSNNSLRGIVLLTLTRQSQQQKNKKELRCRLDQNRPYFLEKINRSFFSFLVFNAASDGCALQARTVRQHPTFWLIGIIHITNIWTLSTGNSSLSSFTIVSFYSFFTRCGAFLCEKVETNI